MCREKEYHNQKRFTTVGSPLRVQGKANSRFNFQFIERITPAFAGKRYRTIFYKKCYRITPACAESNSFTLQNTLCYDHHCVCMEKIPDTHPLKPCPGSPLRVQGKVITTLGNSVVYGITPACAGKSNVGILFAVILQGSPLRVQGKVLK